MLGQADDLRRLAGQLAGYLKVKEWRGQEETIILRTMPAWARAAIEDAVPDMYRGKSWALGVIHESLRLLEEGRERDDGLEADTYQSALLDWLVGYEPAVGYCDVVLQREARTRKGERRIYLAAIVQRAQFDAKTVLWDATIDLLRRHLDGEDPT